MIYLDYSATTKIDKDVLKIVKSDLFTKTYESDLDNYKYQVEKLLNVNLDVIFTSGATESNNIAIKGICENTDKRTIITTHLEHSSINETLNYLEEKGFNIKYVPLNGGIVDLEALRSLIDDDVCLITIASVSSEIGALQPIDEIGKLAKEKNIIFHCDMTQSIGKINIPFDNIDLVSFSAHKFYGPKGIGCLLKNKDIYLKPLIKYERSYNLGLIKGLIKALDLSLHNLEDKIKKVEDLYLYLEKSLGGLPNIIINKPKENIPHILNISVLNYQPETFLHYLELNDIYISTKSACAKGNYSEAVQALANDIKRARSSVRISLSYKTTKDELDKLIDVIEREEHGR